MRKIDVPVRYLCSDSQIQEEYTCDVLVVGGGVAGLSWALHTPKPMQVMVVAKKSLDECNTNRAQGGVAVSLHERDTWKMHLDDTLNAGDGLCIKKSVRALVREGPVRIRELMEWGACFDREEGKLAFTMEAAHQVPRVLHANGDATGHEIFRALAKRVSAQDNVTVRRDMQLVELVTSEKSNVARAAIFLHGKKLIAVRFRAVVFASGGLGALFRESTNEELLRGDSLGVAFRAGCVMRGLPFMQFHPTTLYVAGAPRFLLSEALRGEGGILKNLHGERFMFNYHPRGELAPRDVVSRAIVWEMIRLNSAFVHLDLTHLSRVRTQSRFPNISRVLGGYGLDLGRDPIPIRPAAHYYMGGIKTGLDCRTSLKNVFACGECACNGVHGANRLASNSLLEGLVFSYRGSEALSGSTLPEIDAKKLRFEAHSTGVVVALNYQDLENSLRSSMWRHVGIKRNGTALQNTLHQIDRWLSITCRQLAEQRRNSYEIRNALMIAKAIVQAARDRKESRGGHFREDYPTKNIRFARYLSYVARITER